MTLTINAEDLFSVQKELDLLGNHFSLLDDSDLSEQEFETLLRHCRQDMMNNFVDGSPPLDYDAIYKSIHKSLVEKRRGLAFIWIKNNLPALKDIYEYDANKALQVISNLGKKPKLLTSEQIQEVDEAIKACQKRVDDLEIEGLLAMFFNLSEEKQKIFIKKIESQIQVILPTHQIRQAPFDSHKPNL